MVVLPEPVPPDTTTLHLARTMAPRVRAMLGLNVPNLMSSSMVMRSLENTRMSMVEPKSLMG